MISANSNQMQYLCNPFEELCLCSRLPVLMPLNRRCCRMKRICPNVKIYFSKSQNIFPLLVPLNWALLQYENITKRICPNLQKYFQITIYNSSVDAFERAGAAAVWKHYKTHLSKYPNIFPNYKLYFQCWCLWTGAAAEGKYYKTNLSKYPNIFQNYKLWFQNMVSLYIHGVPQSL